MTEPLTLDPFEQRIAESWPIEKWFSVSVIVAVSGGPDSVAILRALAAIRSQHNLTDGTADNDAEAPIGRFEAAHFNHRWRGKASDDDESFVARLCQQLGIALHVGHTQQSERTEEAARNERYAFLQKTAEQRGARYLVTAHTANDQAETILHRVLRGTGLRGLRGIQFARKLTQAVTVVRPLLWATREDLISYLQRHQQDFRTDASNEDCKFTRNRIRQELLPQLSEEYNPAILPSLLRLGTFAAEAIEELRPTITSRSQTCCISSSAKLIELDVAKLTAESEFMQREILVRLWRERGWPEQSMSFEHWTRMIRNISQQTTECFPGGVRVSVERRTVRLEKQGI